MRRLFSVMAVGACLLCTGTGRAQQGLPDIKVSGPSVVKQGDTATFQVTPPLSEGTTYAWQLVDREKRESGSAKSNVIDGQDKAVFEVKDTRPGYYLVTLKVQQAGVMRTVSTRLVVQDDVADEVVLAASDAGGKPLPAKVFLRADGTLVDASSKPSVVLTKSLSAKAKSGGKALDHALTVWKVEPEDGAVSVVPDAKPDDQSVGGDQFQQDTPVRLKWLKAGTSTLTVSNALSPEAKAVLTVECLPDLGTLSIEGPKSVRPLQTVTFKAVWSAAKDAGRGVDWGPVQGSVLDPAEGSGLKEFTALVRETATGTFSVTARSEEYGFEAAPYEVTTRPKIKEVRLEAKAGESSTRLLAQQVRTYKLVAYDEDDQPATDGRVVVDDNKVVVTPADAAEVEVHGDEIRLRPIQGGLITLAFSSHFEVEGSKIPVGSQSLQVSVLTVEGFSPVSVTLMPMQDDLVRDLYGSPTAKEFIACQVRINNNLLQDDGTPRQKSIIAYSASLLSAVTLEKLGLDRNPKTARTSDWVMVTAADMLNGVGAPVDAGKVNVVRLPSGRGGLDPMGAVVPGQTTTHLRLLPPVGYRLSPAPLVLCVAKASPDGDKTCTPVSPASKDPDGGWAEFDFDAPGEGRYTLTCVYTATLRPRATTEKGGVDATPETFSTTADIEVVERRKFPKQFLYSPYRFAIMESSQVVRANRDNRNTVVSVLEGLGSIGTFIDNVFRVKGQLPDALSNLSGGIIPSYKRLTPDLTDLQRANLIRDIMQPMEEVAYGQDIERTVFFPKGAFRNVLPQYWTRISSIDTTFFQVEVAIVDRKMTTKGGSNGATTGGR